MNECTNVTMLTPPDALSPCVLSWLPSTLSSCGLCVCACGASWRLCFCWSGCCGHGFSFAVCGFMHIQVEDVSVVSDTGAHFSDVQLSLVRFGVVPFLRLPLTFELARVLL